MAHLISQERRVPFPTPYRGGGKNGKDHFPIRTNSGYSGFGNQLPWVSENCRVLHLTQFQPPATVSAASRYGASP